MRTNGHRLALLLLAIGLGACTSQNPLPTVVTAKPANGHDDLGLAGTLVEQQGCVMLRTEGPEPGYVLLIFPSGTTVSNLEGEVVVQTTGAGSAAIGDQVHLGGGSLTPETASTLTEGNIPRVCITKLIFNVGEID